MEQAALFSIINRSFVSLNDISPTPSKLSATRSKEYGKANHRRIYQESTRGAWG